MLTKFPTLSTTRLILRELQSDKPLFPLDCNFEEEIIFTSEQEAEFYNQGWKNNLLFDNHLTWVITEKESNHIIGDCSFYHFSRQHNRVEIAYKVNSIFKDIDYMSEAIQAIINYGFDVLCLQRIEAYINADDQYSINLLAQIGMKSEGILRDYYSVKGKYRAAEVLSLIKTD